MTTIEFMTFEEVAEYLNFSKQEVINYAKGYYVGVEKLPYHKFDDGFCFIRKEIERWKSYFDNMREEEIKAMNSLPKLFI